MVCRARCTVKRVAAAMAGGGGGPNPPGRCRKTYERFGIPNRQPRSGFPEYQIANLGRVFGGLEYQIANLGRVFGFSGFRVFVDGSYAEQVDPRPARILNLGIRVSGCHR